MRVAFDIDDTIYKVVPKKVRGGDCVLGCVGNDHECGNYTFSQVPDYALIQVLLWFAKNGDTVYVWSAGGESYAQTIVEKLGLDDIVKVIEKKHGSAIEHKIELTFDDQDVALANTNVQIRR